MDAYVIANPRAGTGRGASAIEEALARAGVRAEVVVTQRPRHGVDLARAARAAGRGLVVAAGGDGTVHEVVNGLLEADGAMPVLGVLPIGSGCDYVKTFGIPHNLDEAARVLAAPREPMEVDAGEIECGGRTRRFANIANAGFGPAVAERAARLPRRLGPLMYLAAFWLTLPRFSRPMGIVHSDADVYEGPLMNLVVANGRVFGGGMRIAPTAEPSDGAFDVQVHWGSKADYVRAIPKVYRATHIPHPKILERRAATVTVRCEPETLVEADGEMIGSTPATFRVLPRALRLKV